MCKMQEKQLEDWAAVNAVFSPKDIVCGILLWGTIRKNMVTALDENLKI